MVGMTGMGHRGQCLRRRRLGLEEIIGMGRWENDLIARGCGPMRVERGDAFDG